MSSRIKGIIDAVSDLAMDYSSRMARAQEQGFDTDTPYYHGTPAEDIDAFDLLPERRRFPKSFGVHMANTKNEATHYKPPTSGSVQELYAAPQNTLEIDIPRGGHFVSASMKADLDRDDIIRQLVDAKRDGSPYDSVRVRKDMSPDWADWSGKEGYNENLIMLDPTRVRSVNAAFDPAKKDSANLLAGVTGAGLLGGSMFASEDADAGILSRIKAFHGSPHDFDKFSTENIGTGEGAQAYGHGLYFAEREGTAKSYKNELSASVDYDGKPILRRNKQVGSTGDADLDDSLIADLGDVDKSIKFWENDLQSDSDDLRDYAAIQIEKLKNAKSKVKTTGGGHMYEVDISASADDLLDYDVPLKDQPERIQNAFKDIWRDGITDDPILKEIYKTADDVDFNTMGLLDQSRGSQAYREFAKKSGGEASLSKLLNDKGVKGIKYADAQTRFSPKGRTNNYVMFDDKTIEVARKYGVAMPVAAAILAGTVTPQDAQASTKPEGKGLLDSIGDTALETMSGVNRAAADGVNFLTSDQINAILNLSGSDKRIPDLYDIPGVESGTKGNYMEPGLLRQIVRQGSEFLSPI